MPRGTFPQAAGRTTPGTTPLLARPQNPSRRPVSATVKAGQRSNLTGQPLRSPCPISNRNFQQLEIAVTSTKQTFAPSSNRNFRGTNLHRICEQSLPTTATSNRQRKGLEIAASPTKHSPNLSLIDNKKQLLRKIACRAGCLPAIKPAIRKQPRCRTATLSTNSHPTNPAISNRQWKGLEIPATPTKNTRQNFL